MISVADSRPINPAGQRFALAFFVAFLLACSEQAQPVYLEGATMGTRYHITLVPEPDRAELAQIEQAIDVILNDINESMSTYLDSSEISEFNRLPQDQWLTLSEEFMEVLQIAYSIWLDSDSAYDVSVGPLVDLWGFGPQIAQGVPSEVQVKRALAGIGLEAIQIDSPNNRVRKLAPRQLDFSSLAKGYAVDRVALWLESRRVENYLVEIGGEIKVAGANPGGEHWRLAIERPQPGRDEPMAVLSLNSAAVATSGDYRNYFEVDGVHYSHAIDPQTGYPVEHELVSVTVVAVDAVVADAWATALLVLGSEQALEVAAANDLAVYLIRRDQNGYSVSKTEAMQAYLQ